jgi:hypothetical protein
LVPRRPAPFNALIGEDSLGPSFLASWTFIYAPGPLAAASVTLGIGNSDGTAPGDQVASFTVDGMTSRPYSMRSSRRAAPCRPS